MNRIRQEKDIHIHTQSTAIIRLTLDQAQQPNTTPNYTTKITNNNTTFDIFSKRLGIRSSNAYINQLVTHFNHKYLTVLT